MNLEAMTTAIELTLERHACTAANVDVPREAVAKLIAYNIKPLIEGMVNIECARIRYRYLKDPG